VDESHKHTEQKKLETKQNRLAGWFTPIILATWEAEMGRRPAWAKKFARSHLSGKKLGMVTHICHPSNGRKSNTQGATQASLGKKRDPTLKITRA
jgi:hypothetical protein